MSESMKNKFCPSKTPPRKFMVRWMRMKSVVSLMRKTYLLELLDGTLVNTTALVDQVTWNVWVGVSSKCFENLTSGCWFTWIDMADNDDVDMSLFFTVDLSVDVLSIMFDSHWRLVERLTPCWRLFCVKSFVGLCKILENFERYSDTTANCVEVLRQC